jgi:uncharacterized membrane protein
VRVTSIDFLRGLVITLMTLDHTRDSFSNFNIGPLIGLETPTEIFFTRWITHLCAPIFVFLAGMAIYLHKLNKNLPRPELQTFLIKRGLFLIFLEFSLISFLWIKIFNVQGTYIFSAQVIWAIGMSMLFMAALLFFSDWLILAIGLTIICTNNIFDIYTSTDSIIWNILHNRASIALGSKATLETFYPLYPWLGLMAVGYGFCHLLYCNKTLFPTIGERKKMLAKLSFIMITTFVVLRFFNLYGDSSQFNHNPDFIIALKSFLEVTKYPPSLHYLLITLGIGFALFSWAEGRDNKIIKIFSNYGSVPLFYYALHLITIPVLNFIISKLLGQEYPYHSHHLWISWLMSLLIIALLYPAVLWFKNFKTKHRQKFPILTYF